MGALSRSWTLTKLTFSIIGKDKEMVIFPLIGTIAAILYSGAILVPGGALQLMTSGDIVMEGIGFIHLAFLFVLYLGLSFIASFCNVCVVYTTKTRFEGGDATFAESFQYGIRKSPLIFQWSIIAATVGVLLFLIEAIAEKFGRVGQMVIRMVRSILGMVWSVMTIFVIPVLVYEDVSPTDALRRSAEVLKSTWGESIVRSLGLALVQGFVIFSILALAMGLCFTFPNEQVAPIVLSISFIAILAVVLVFNVAHMVFNTALYIYASTGKEPSLFEGGSLEKAFSLKP